MFEKGQIVFHDKVVFEDGKIDSNKKRPNIVLFEFDFNGEKLVCTCPVIYSLSSFNNFPDEYILIPESVIKRNRLCFAKINSIGFYKQRETYSTNHIISSYIPNKIIMMMKKSNSLKYQIVHDYLQKIELPIEENSKKQKKKNKK